MDLGPDFVRVSHFYVGVFLPASVILPLGIGAYQRVYAQRRLRPIYYYLIISGITNILAKLLGAAHTNNLPVLHIYTIIEFLVLLSYYNVLLADKLRPWLIRLLALAFPVAAVLDFLLLQSLYTFNSYPRAFACIIIILLSSYYFLTEDRHSAQPQPDKWVNFGLLQYFGSAVFMFAFSNMVYEHTSRQDQNIIGLLHATLVLIMYLLIAVGFGKAQQSG